MKFTPAEKLAELRAQLLQLDLQAYIIPTNDSHESEYPVASERRREYISGFTGSAGTALVTLDAAHLWTDGRYHLQAAEELDSKCWTLMKSGAASVPTIEDFLTAAKYSRVGFDPFVCSKSWYENMKEDLPETMHLIPVHAGTERTLPEGASKWDITGQKNLVDIVWNKDGTRPQYPTAKIVPMTQKYCGFTVTRKLQHLRSEMERVNAGVLVLAALDDVAWLTNLRGLDVPTSRIFLSFAVITNDGETSTCTIFVKGGAERLTAGASAVLSEAGIEVLPYELVVPEVIRVSESLAKDKAVWIDTAVNLAVTKICTRTVEKASNDTTKVIEKSSPVRISKAIKNPSEVHGMNEAHLQDGAALTFFFSWLESLTTEERIKLDECTAADQLEKYRRSQPEFVVLSFDTISSFGPNGAIIHYRPEPATAAKLGTTGMYLVDSGGHYLGGTTDVTRTVYYGKPSEWERELYTRVLMGHVDIDTLVFPPSATGTDIDILARRPLWDIGLDYMHGTGHGVGASLLVHEFPPGIGRRGRSESLFEPGMVVSNEPGVYLPGQFGIRIENLVVVEKRPTPHRFNDTTFYGFRTLTKFPYCRDLIDVALLGSKRVQAVDAYHAVVMKEVEPYIRATDLPAAEKERAVSWLREACRPLRSD